MTWSSPSSLLPPLTPCNKPQWSYYTSSPSFLLLPVILPPSALPLFTPSTGKSSSWFFSHKRAEANWILAALQFPGLWLQAEGGGRREDTARGKGGRTGSWGPRKKGEKKGREKCCVIHFKALTDNITRWGWAKIHSSDRGDQIDKTIRRMRLQEIGREKKMKNMGKKGAARRNRLRHRLVGWEGDTGTTLNQSVSFNQRFASWKHLNYNQT